MTSVLVVDDQEDVRRALAAVVEADPDLSLAGAGASACEAVGIARDRLPDVALVDFKMPGGGGPQVVRDLLAVSPDTRIVALSAYGDRSSVAQMLGAGAAGYLVKGATAREVRLAIDRAHRGESWFSSEAGTSALLELTERLRREEHELAHAAARRANIDSALRPGAIQMVFQPIVRLTAPRSVLGYEGLARFTADSSRPTEAWFAEARSIGMSAELEHAAIHALGESEGLLPSGCRVGVNVSPDALRTRRIRDALAASPYGLERLTIEVTEHVAIDDYAALELSLDPLRAAGAHLAIDDVGAGYASLRHILHLAPDLIKIDRSVVAEVETDRTARALVRALVHVADELELTTVAEGVEREETARILLELGVCAGQGYHLGRPVPPAELEAPLR